LGRSFQTEQKTFNAVKADPRSLDRSAVRSVATECISRFWNVMHTTRGCRPASGSETTQRRNADSGGTRVDERIVAIPELGGANEHDA
jgi:hypothetical protein